MRRAIVSVGVRGNYVQHAQRLERSLRAYPEYERHIWFGDYPMWSPTHEQVSHAFKLFAMLQVLRAGADQVLWVDANMYAIASPRPIFDAIDKDGVYLVDDGWKNGEWCSDAALPLLRVTREQAMKQPTIWSAVVGLDRHNIVAQAILDAWARHAIDGSFNGAHTNDMHEVSEDSRVKGHRHDQTALTTIVHRLSEEGRLCMDEQAGRYLNTIITPRGKHADYDERPGVVFVKKGGPCV